jgi:Zn-dependent alcohol dehydrogenase
MLKTINFYTEKGNVSVKARSAVKEQAVAMLKANVAGIVETERGLAIPVANTERGETLYVFIDVTVSTSTAKAEKKAKAKEVVSVDVPNLFE